MLTPAEAQALAHELEQLRCTDSVAGDGLFIFVFKGEPVDQSARYESHIRSCEFCRVALAVYRYKRDVAGLLGKEAKRRDGGHD